MTRRLLGVAAGLCSLAATTTIVMSSATASGPLGAPRSPDSGPEVYHDTSPALAGLRPRIDAAGTIDHERDDLLDRMLPPGPTAAAEDTVVQTSAATAAPPATSANFEGLGDGFTGPQGTYLVNVAPPDTSLAVGESQVFEFANEDIAIFDKGNGTVLYGPVPTNTVFTGFGGPCETTNDGDGIVRYDTLAKRWVLLQFALNSPGVGADATLHYVCVAVSATSDALGAYHRYAFGYATMPDYPKLGVWPDAYYVTLNTFATTVAGYVGPEVCALERAAMLDGKAARQQCFTPSSSYLGLEPADLDGSTPPPAGAPNVVLALDRANVALAYWRFHVDWTNTAATALTGPVTLAVAPYAQACGGGACVPQPASGDLLDSLGNRLMFRLAYRNHGGYESLVASHSVTASGGQTGIRWYELRLAGGDPVVHQQGTYAPDGHFRWMPAIAESRDGDIAIGYSVSSENVAPSIRFTGRLAGDPLGEMTQGEGTIVDGVGSQNGGLARWGDYSAMSVDPVDDCTFWYATEYLAETGSFNWHTRIGAFALPGCGQAADFGLSSAPNAGAVTAGDSVSATVATTVRSGRTQRVTLAATGLPQGATASFAPPAVDAGGTSTMTVTTAPSVAPGTYPLTIEGTGTSGTRTTAYTLTVNARPPDFAMTVNPGAGTVTADDTVTTTIGTSVTSGPPDRVSFSVTGVPAGVTVSFAPPDVTAGESATMTLATTSAAAAGTYPITVTGTGTAAVRTAGYTLTVSAPPPPPPPPAPDEFSLSLVPDSALVGAGGSATATVTTAVTSGSAQQVTLSATGVPTGVTVSFAPAQVRAGESATMSVTAAPGARSGTSTFDVVGTGPSATRTAPFHLTVDADAPVVTVSSPSQPFSLATAVSTSYSAPGAVSYDVRYRTAAWNGAFGDWVQPAAWQGTTRLTQSMTAQPGREYCFGARARDAAGNVSGWSAPLCTAVALDDRALARNTTGWTRATGSGYYRGTVTSASARGAELRLAGAQLRRLALVVRTCPGCGTVAIYLNGAYWRSVSTYSATTRYRVVLLQPAFGTRTATITVRVTTSGKPVSIDGIGITRD